jgi:hypothetical protein
LPSSQRPPNDKIVVETRRRRDIPQPQQEIGQPLDRMARPNQVAFARSPAFALGENLLDYTSKEGQSFYAKACEPLPEKFDGEPIKLKLFLTRFKEKATQFAWMPMLTYRIGDRSKNLCDHYGEISREQIRDRAIEYLEEQGRRAQNSEQMFHCISASLTSDVFAKVVNADHNYTLDVAGELLTDGPSLLKVVVDSAYTNTRSSSAIVRTNLSNLDRYMESLKDSNIELFHYHVKENVKMLDAAGETTSDLLVNLFKAYRLAKDKPFVSWVAHKRSAWYEGILPLNPNGNQLMELAESYYKDSVATGEWMRLTDDEQKIIALETQIQDLKQKKNPKQDKTKGGKKNKGRNREKEERKWAWKKKPPKQGDKHTKTFQDKTYHWCSKHKQWTVHKPSECHLKEQAPKEKKTETEAPEETKLNRQALRSLIKLAAIGEESDEE